MTPPSAEPVLRAGRQRRPTDTEAGVSTGDATGSRIAGISDHASWLRQEAAFCARVPCHVIVRGETGSGKGVFVDEVRRLSPPHTPFLKVPASNLVAELSASQLLGHQRGAFTGAEAAASGFAELASGGVLVLDDADDLPSGVQQLLLSVAEGGDIWPLGSRRPIRVQLRLIVLLHEEPDELVRHGRMRADLAYRLASGADVPVLPLRERLQDLPSLALALLESCCAEVGATVPAIDRCFLQVLTGRAWPGNVRQLESVIRRALLSLLRQEDDPQVLSCTHLQSLPAVVERARTRRHDLTAAAIEQALLQHGSAVRAAAALGVSLRTLWRRKRELHL